MDLETYNRSIGSTYLGNGKTLIPYLLCWYDGGREQSNSYFIDPSLGDRAIKNIIYQAMKDICIRKYKGYKIYFHNFAKFDGYFLIRYLSQLGICEPIIHKGKIISCKFRLYESKYNVTFLDSQLMLPSSLKDLCESFNISKEDSKSIFPFLLNNISYQGSVPEYKYFTNISPEEYQIYKKSYTKIWNFKEEAIKYCTLDCISLLRILTKFNKLIFRKFKLNIVNYLTLPSLAFNLFLSKYLKKDTIHMLTGETADNIRSSYTGGATDMYLTKPIKGRKVYAYDVNSLYPFVMKTLQFLAKRRLLRYPIGTPTYFQGGILKIDPQAFGFFYCKIYVRKRLVISYILFYQLVLRLNQEFALCFQPVIGRVCTSLRS